MKKITTATLLLLVIAFLLIVFKSWIFFPQIIGGDWPYFYQETINGFGILPLAWSSVQGNGFGGPVLVYALDSYLYFTGWLFSNVLHIPWEIVYKFVWFGMFLFLGTFSIYRLLKEQLPNVSVLFRSLGIVVFLANTYVLLVVGGGQMGVALGYAIAPLVLLAFIKVIQGINSKSRYILFSLYAGLLFSLQVLFDFRIAYITLLAVVIYALISLISLKANKIKFILEVMTYSFIIPLIITGLVHSFWLLPFLFTGQTSVEQLGSGYTTTEAVKFFSFAKFENAFGLFHPNWPENIFGKVSFMKAEFLLLPIIAFLSLLFIDKTKQKELQNSQKITILYFSLLALIGIFLAKGANDPFGNTYIAMFKHIPGFIMFRDPTKFYMLICLAYAFLIPFSLHAVSEWFIERKKKNTQKRYTIVSYVISLLFLVYLGFLIKPSFMGELKGTFTKHTVSEDYIQFKDTIVNDDGFYRTLWIPKVQRFTYSSQNHPAVEASVLFKATNSAELIKQLRSKDIDRKLQELSIRYVVIPVDSEQEIFVKDRKYNAKERAVYQKELYSYSWLKKVNEYKDLDVYELNNFKDRLWIKEGGALSYKKISGSEFKIHTSSSNYQTIIFSESYSPYWKLLIGSQEFESKKYNNSNSFVIPAESNNKELVLHYSLEKYYQIGRVISAIALVGVFTLIFVLRKRVKNK